MSARVVNVRCVAFACEGPRSYRVRVTPDGRVRVWDAIGGHFTSCHSMGLTAQRRAIRKAWGPH